MSAEYSQLVDFKNEFDKACAEREVDIEKAVLEMADYLIATVTPLTPVYAPKDIDGHTYHAYENGGKIRIFRTAEFYLSADGARTEITGGEAEGSAIEIGI